MANASSGNIIHVDTGSSLVKDTSNWRVTSIILTSAAAGDTLVLSQSSTGGDMITVKCAVANDSKHFDLTQSPVVFKDGIYVKSITSGAKAMLIISQAGTNGST